MRVHTCLNLCSSDEMVNIIARRYTLIYVDENEIGLT